MTPTATTQAVPTSPADGTPLPELDPAVIPNLDDLVTEDDKAVDNIYTEKLYRLLTEPLYSSWAGPGEGRSFLALANVGWFHTYGQPPLVSGRPPEPGRRPCRRPAHQGRAFLLPVVDRQATRCADRNRL